MPPGWYAIHSKPRKEAFLHQQLELHGLECFYPRLRVQVVNPRAARVRAYFPGYVFAHLDPSEAGFSLLAWLPGATRLVSFGGDPAQVPDALINALRIKLERLNAFGGELKNELKPGDLVEIQAGPFAGYEAIFDEQLDGAERVRVLLKLMERRQLPVELPATQVQRARPKKGSK